MVTPWRPVEPLQETAGGSEVTHLDKHQSRVLKIGRLGDTGRGGGDLDRLLSRIFRLAP